MIYQFVAGNDPVSTIIEAYERGVWSHVDCVLADGSLLGARSDSIGGKPPGVQVRPANYASWSLVNRIEIIATAKQETDWHNFLYAQIGKPYDTIDLLANFGAGRDWRNPEAWWCSELAAAAGEASFLAHPIGQGVQLITPRDWFIIASPWGVVS